jgi:hypothetical protein
METMVDASLCSEELENGRTEMASNLSEPLSSQNERFYFNLKQKNSLIRGRHLGHQQVFFRVRERFLSDRRYHRMSEAGHVFCYLCILL